MKEDSRWMEGSGMEFPWSGEGSDARFASDVAGLSGCLGHADRVAPMRSYRTGLLLPGARKSVEPMAARHRWSRLASWPRTCRSQGLAGGDLASAARPSRWPRASPPSGSARPTAIPGAKITSTGSAKSASTTRPGAGQAQPRAPNRRYARLRSSPGMPDHITSRGRKMMTAGWRCGPERFDDRGICTKR